ncbi:MAG: hypothetical protein IT562_11680 [Alphaproteobacteria bacterium]|nr:hypothetical protein [Alphaproteobacteria bacterium]
MVDIRQHSVFADSGRALVAPRAGVSRQTVAGMLATAAVAAMLTISDSFLYWIGVNYTAPGGSLLGKLHPGSYLVMMAFLAATLPVNPVRYLGALARTHPSIVVYALVTVGIMAYCTARFGISGAAFINETLFAPALLAMTLFALPQTWRRRVFLVALSLVALDAVIGLVEFMTRQRLVPYFISGELHVEPQFRATSLMGHPLKNATIIATFLCLLPVLRHHRAMAVTTGLAMALSLLAFGSRTAFAICLLVGAIALARWYLVGLMRRQFSYAMLTGVGFMALVTPVAAIIVMLFLGQQSRIFETLKWDPSAQSRTLVLRAFDRLSMQDFLFGLGPDGIGRVMEHLRSFTILTDIENFWVLLLLNFGLICWVLFVLAFGWLVWSLLRGAPAAAKVATLVFFIMISSNNSLAVKDSSLSLFVVAMMGAAAYARLADPAYKPSTASAAASNTRRGFFASRGTTAPSPG